MRTRLVIALTAVATSAAVLIAANPSVVQTDAGLVAAASNSPDGVRVFRGIPFGAPPLGPLRWKAPQPVAHWDGVRKGDAFGPVCVQPKGSGRLNVSVDMPDSPPANEDCLYLNVWTGATRANERRPVMVWIFGGAYTEGAGSSRHNDGEALARKGAVVVTFNYRLGPFGFFSHPELDAESGHDASGNQAVWDCLAALKWVQSNVAGFGGDPLNVTIFGESAGAALSAGLVGSPEAKGLFRRAISESGAWMGLSMATMRSRESAENPGTGRGATPMAALPLSELRMKSTEDITKGLRGAGMIVDGWAIPEDESVTFMKRRQNAVDVLIGSNKDEGAFILRGPTAEQWKTRVRGRWGDLAEAYLKLYPAGSDEEAEKSSEHAFSDEMAWEMRRYAHAQAALGKKVFLYYFTHEPPTEPGKPNLRAVHTAEIPYVFNNLRAARVFPDTSSPNLAAASDAERKLADMVSSYWVNFARSGDPNGKGLAAWPQFKDNTSGRAMMLDDASQPETAPNTAKLDLYDQLYERQLKDR
ncbi:MAG TPA: carboxylesterase family protein [Vicinamibacterales bacterium]|nr:carboxylesterase family protein [Vicinamibacterales bacterium]